jgi:hypothetical protein
MKFLLETTDWGDAVPNHTYIMDDGKNKAVAYIRAGTKTVFKFKKPIQIDLRGRKFKEVPNTFGWADAEDEVAEQRWEVTGSKGDKYIVQKIDNMLQCTCSGFKFRGACRHTKEIA